jgi:hypothetical protein
MAEEMPITPGQGSERMMGKYRRLSDQADRYAQGHPMRYHEVQRRPAAPDTHPFVADMTMTPAAFDDFERATEHQRDVRLLCRIDRPDSRVVHVACASEAARRRLLAAWG